MEMEEILLIEYFNDHFYRVKKEGKDHYIASVTTKLGIEKKPGIERWRGDVGNREADLRMNEAGDRGKRIHYAWYCYIMGGTVIYNPWQAPLYDEKRLEEIKKDTPFFMVLKTQDEMLQLWKLQRFFEAVKPQIIDAELKVYSIEKDIAGTLDNAFYIEKGIYDVSGRNKLTIPQSGIYIADLKTGKVVDESVWNQIAPYAYCYEKRGNEKVLGGIVLHTGASTKGGIPGLSVPLRLAEDLKHDLDIYFKIADIWKERNPNYGPEIFSFPSIIKR